MSDEEPALPPEYYADALAMAKAAQHWVDTHPFAEIRFRPEFESEIFRAAGKSVAPGERGAIISALEQVIDHWAANADTRAFLRAINEAVGGRATYAQMRAIYDAAVERQIESSSGQLTPEMGNWACSTCGEVLDGFTSMRPGEKPEPGSLSLCIYCAEIQRVNAAGNGFDALSTSEFNRLPKAHRIEIRRMQAGARKIAAEMKAKRARQS